MVNDLYLKVVELLGELPLELDWLYSVGTILMLLIILLAFLTPFLLIFYFVKRSWLYGVCKIYRLDFYKSLWIIRF